MSEVKAQLPPLLEDIAGLGDAPENLLWKPQNTEVCSNIEIKIFLLKIFNSLLSVPQAERAETPDQRQVRGEAGDLPGPPPLECGALRPVLGRGLDLHGDCQLPAGRAGCGHQDAHQ